MTCVGTDEPIRVVVQSSAPPLNGPNGYPVSRPLTWESVAILADVIATDARMNAPAIVTAHIVARPLRALIASAKVLLAEAGIDFDENAEGVAARGAVAARSAAGHEYASDQDRLSKDNGSGPGDGLKELMTKPKHYSRSSVYNWMGNPLGIAEQMDPGDTIDADALPCEEDWPQFRKRLAEEGMALSKGVFTVVKVNPR